MEYQDEFERLLVKIKGASLSESHLVSICESGFKDAIRWELHLRKPSSLCEMLQVREGLPVFAVGVGLSKKTFDRASVHYYVQSHIQINEYRDRVILPAATKKYGKHISNCIKILDMAGLKLSALNQIKFLTTITSIDDLNYPEKAQTYYIVNAPYVFSACWKVRVNPVTLSYDRTLHISLQDQ
ncbi:SEC14 cytosolic factor-like [Salvia hispanica]|uniref:SEC14 cytosolic factor-like n=1 Tax=Salvia hispanica TaxID=49212 RepID=UPI0020096CAE|nr:SEC14 cytosolic factor-like [Salvia hispanica]